MQIKIISTGKLKEKSYQQISDEFTKRIRPYCSEKIIEIQAENLKTVSTEKIAREKEAQRIIPHIADDDFVITLEIEGKTFSSEEFAQKIKQLSNSGLSQITFIIGGATGLDESIKQRSDLALSFSKMTFTHQFVRLILEEQIYRAFKIINNEPYHK
ncbi:MAG: 23S rRNA (pseudouridine(1915)-N(3))-methyltransferase RlmH [Candidatus Gastranaerophilales bacterium]|nr:23S rRNA (pseudouridine(1915)-N(3))-methyltransferase RlmH [Candidatus Gastranaerophilales bacterium]